MSALGRDNRQSGTLQVLCAACTGVRDCCTMTVLRDASHVSSVYRTNT